MKAWIRRIYDWISWCFIFMFFGGAIIALFSGNEDVATLTLYMLIMANIWLLIPMKRWCDIDE